MGGALRAEAWDRQHWGLPSGKQLKKGKEEEKKKRKRREGREAEATSFSLGFSEKNTQRLLGNANLRSFVVTAAQSDSGGRGRFISTGTDISGPAFFYRSGRRALHFSIFAWFNAYQGLCSKATRCLPAFFCDDLAPLLS